ncbi:MAG: hypothetical protein M3O23_00870 [Actinomycetota bacterium]|nr:hypothetical protein [Actinomycetota bacterium]
MPTHHVKYQGPPSLAVPVATLLADAEGVELTAAEKPEHLDGSVESVLLAMTVEGTTEAVTAAVGLISGGLPAEATVSIDGATAS